MEEQEEKNQIQALISDIRGFINTKTELTALQIKRITAQLVSATAASLTLILFFLFVLVLLSFAASFYLNEVIGNTYGGFLITAAFYFLLALIIIWRKESIKNVIENMMIRQLFKEQKDEEDED
jgi:hypothetical protein